MRRAIGICSHHSDTGASSGHPTCSALHHALCRHQAAAAELSTLAACERDEVGAERARLERLLCAKGRAEKRAQAATRFARAEEW